MRVLIVEDELLIAAFLRQFLEKKGFEVCKLCASGEQALELCSQENPDLAILDVNLAGSISGIDVAAKLNESREIPCLFLTALANDQRLKALNGSFRYSIKSKPYRMDDVFHALKELSNPQNVKQTA